MNKKDHKRFLKLIEKKRHLFELKHQPFYKQLNAYSKTGKNLVSDEDSNILVNKKKSKK